MFLAEFIGSAGPDQHFERAALHFFRLKGIDEVAWGQNQRARGQNLSLPVVREAEVDDGSGIGHGRLVPQLNFGKRVGSRGLKSPETAAS
jgi:hypothetical protein